MVQTNHTNSPTPRLSERWRRVTPSTQEARIIAICWNPNRLDTAYFRRNCKFVSVQGPEVKVRIIGELEEGAVGDLLRNLEQYLRRHIREPLEVYCESRADGNKPRDPIQRQKIRDWLSARRELKQQAADE